MKTIILSIVISFTFVGCQTTAEPESIEVTANNQLSQAQMDLAEIKTAPISKHVIKKSVKCRGVIDIPPQNKASVTAPLGGKVEMVMFYPGDKVAKGTTLCTLTDQHFIELQQNFLTALVELENLKTDYERKEQLKASDATSIKSYQLAKTQYKNAEIKVDGLRKKLQWAGFPVDQIEQEGIVSALAISSPITGYITDVNVNLGTQIGEGAVLYEMVDNSHLHLEIQVYQKDIGFIEKGQKIEFYIPGVQKVFEGEVYLIGQKVDDATHTINIHGHFDEQSSLLKPGTVFQAEILTANDTVYALPNASIIEEDEKFYAYQYQNETLTKIPLVLGIADENFTQIINADDLGSMQIVQEGVYCLQSN